VLVAVRQNVMLGKKNVQMTRDLEKKLEAVVNEEINVAVRLANVLPEREAKDLLRRVAATKATMTEVVKKRILLRIIYIRKSPV
jgi:hypothetical protein